MMKTPLFTDISPRARGRIAPARATGAQRLDENLVQPSDINNLIACEESRAGCMKISPAIYDNKKKNDYLCTLI